MKSRSSFAIDVDASVLAAAKTGDPIAQRHIYELFERPVYSLALRICQNADDAYDALQDCFVNALGRLDQFSGSSPFWGWIRRIAINSTLQRMRVDKRYQSRFASLDEIALEPEGCSENPGDQADLQMAFRQLGDTARAVIWLHDVEGLRHREIAEAMGKTVSFSKSQLARGRQRLRGLLTQEPGDTPCRTLNSTA